MTFKNEVFVVHLDKGGKKEHEIVHEIEHEIVNNLSLYQILVIFLIKPFIISIAIIHLHIPKINFFFKGDI